RRPPFSSLLPYTTLFRSPAHSGHGAGAAIVYLDPQRPAEFAVLRVVPDADLDLADLTLMSPLGDSGHRRDEQGDDPDDRGRRQHGTRITHQQYQPDQQQDDTQWHDHSRRQLL